MKRAGSGILFGLLVLGLFLSGCAGDSTPPARVRDLVFVWDANSLTRVNGRLGVVNPAPPVNTRVLAWTAPGDDGNHGRAAQFDVRCFTQTTLAEKGWTPPQAFRDHLDEAKQLHREPNPFRAGDAERWFLPRLDVSETYYFALTTKDEVDNESKLSNLAGPAQPSLLALALPGAAGPEPGLGGSVANAQNVIGSYFTDLLVGSPLAGQALVYAGAPSRDLLDNLGPPGLKVKRVKPELLPTVTLRGSPGDQFGAAVAGIGKFSRSTRPDLAIGAPEADLGAGRVYLFHGDRLLEGDVPVSEADVVIRGESPGDHLGAGLAALGDLDKDDFSDFAVAAPGAGKVYVFLGGNAGSKRGTLPSGKTAAETAAVILVGDTAEKFGTALAAAGDLNGDGYHDLIVGAPAAVNPDTAVAGGAVYVFYGGDAGGLQILKRLKTPGSQVVVNLAGGEPADVAIYGAVAGSGFGAAVAAAGKLVKRVATDSARDLAVGAPGLAQVEVFYGGIEGVLFHPPTDPPHFEPVVGTDEANRSALLQGDTASGFGQSVIGAGDVNRDGFDDLAVGLPALEAVRIYFWKDGPTTEFHQLQLSSFPGSGFGAAMAPAGDLNKDGYADLIIGAPLAGLVYLEF